MVTRTQSVVKGQDLTVLATKLREGIPVQEPVPGDYGRLIDYLKDIDTILEPGDRPLFTDGDIALGRKAGMKFTGFQGAVAPKPTVKGKSTVLATILGDEPAPVKPVAQKTTVKVSPKGKKTVTVKPAPAPKILNRMEIFAEIVGSGMSRKDMVEYMVARFEEQGGQEGMESIAETRVSQYTGLLKTLGLGKWVNGAWVYEIEG